MDTVCDTLISPDVRLNELPDDLIIHKILDGHKDLFEKLMKRYNQRLYRVIRGYMKNEEDIQDVMQETYLKAFENLSGFRSDASFSTWLIRIGINESLQKLRKIKRKWLFFSNEMKDRNTISPLSYVDKMNPEKRTIQHETRKIIEQAIDHLPVKYRSVYLMREVEGLDIEETARCLGITSGNVKVRLYRAKGLLKKELKGQTAEHPVFEFGNEKCDELIATVMKKIRDRAG